MEQVTALIKTFLRDGYLFNCVASLKQQAPKIQIIVADDGHTSDEKEQRLLKMGVSQYIRLPFNSAPIARGRNVMVDAAKTPYVLIGDDDFTYTAATKLGDMWSMMGIVDIVGGAVKENEVVLHYEGRFARENSETIRMLALDGKFYLHDKIPFKPADYVFNFFIAKTDVLRKVRWDEHLHASYEHEDFFLSAQKAATKIAYCPNSVVLHRYGPPDTSEYQKYRHSGDHSDKVIFEKKWGFRLI